MATNLFSSTSIVQAQKAWKPGPSTISAQNWTKVGLFAIQLFLTTNTLSSQTPTSPSCASHGNPYLAATVA